MPWIIKMKLISYRMHLGNSPTRKPTYAGMVLSLCVLPLCLTEVLLYWAYCTRLC